MMIDFRNVDCMELMSEYEDNHFNLAIVDPPYRDQNQPTADMRKSGSMKSLEGRPSLEYFAELIRVSKEQIVFGANNFQLPQFKGFIVWDKHIPMDFSMSMAEIASLSEGLGTVSKIFSFRVAGQKFRIHPTQKPVELYTWILSNYATCKECDNTGFVESNTSDCDRKVCSKCKGESENYKILDTHVGSASSLIACHQLGFDVVGCELDKEYYKLAQQRIKEETAQISLF